ncbi:MAG: GAF domain-containing protein [Bdellovibrionaceae bacterium]|nr:GAF domain-containing protein [Bdellovibrionales bacterium]MCB9083260.1 GAF domain-containing protein [Pseudobdellovibrionaceae bacterium]
MADSSTRLEQQYALFRNLSLAPEFYRGDFTGFSRIATKAISEYFNVQRVGVWLLDNEQRALVSTVQYDSSTGEYSSGTVFPVEMAKLYFAKIFEDRSLPIHDSLTDPVTAEFRESYCRPLNIGALLDSVIHCGADIVGVICLEHVGGPRQWQLDEIFSAGILADQLGNVFALKERDHLLSTMEDHNLDLEKRIKARTSDLEDVLKNQTALLRGICHDLVNSINVVTASCELGRKNPKVDFFDRIMKACSAVVDMTQEVRSFCQFTDKYKQRPALLQENAQAPLLEVCQKSSFVLGDRMRIKSIELEIDIESLCDVVVLAEPFPLVHSVVSNLLSNAIKFSPAQSHIEVRAVHGDGDEIGLVIRDFGTGMSSEKVAEIQRAVTAVESTDGTGGEAGTGYGLMQVKFYLERYGGRMTIRSWQELADGQPAGTEVTLWLKRLYGQSLHVLNSASSHDAA